MLSGEFIIENFLTYVAEYSEAVKSGDHILVNEIHGKLHGLYDIAKEAKSADIFERFCMCKKRM